ncbi:MAG TPA: RIP metalloprotease RseP [Bryobacteraceae bacterium]|nr:RIP metalloprotease RseP [Bryobacteraceae bacterium]
MPAWVIYVPSFVVLISIMIMIHEFGHFWAARHFNVKVESFSFGFGPRLFGFRRGETDFRVSAILFGGYVKMAGEQATDENLDDPRSFLAKPRWQRLIIALAGPFMNAVLAVSLLTGLYMVKFEKLSDADMQPVIGHVAADSPAAKAGIRDGDLIIKLEDKNKPTWEDVMDAEVAGAKRPMHLSILRNGSTFTTTLTPVLSESMGVGYAGWDGRGEIQLGEISPGFPAEKAGLRRGDIVLSIDGEPIHSRLRFQEITKASGGKPVQVEYVRGGRKAVLSVQPVWAAKEGPARWMIGVAPEAKLDLVVTRLSLPDAFRESLRENAKSATMIVQVLERMLQRRMSAKNLAGPLELAHMSGAAAKQGLSPYLMLMALVSLNLAIFNLLPIPILDGGTILMLLVEMIMQRDLSMKVKENVFKAGFVFIMVLMAFVIFNDISRYIPAG